MSALTSISDLIREEPTSEERGEGDDRDDRDDRMDLLRWEIASIARWSVGSRVLARAAKTAQTSEEWDEIAADLLSIGRILSRKFAISASGAATHIARGNVSDAVETLANSCGITAREWCDTTREEMRGETKR